jgi:hypothetical protein
VKKKLLVFRRSLLANDDQRVAIDERRATSDERPSDEQMSSE